MKHAAVLHEDDLVFLGQFPGFLVSDPLLEPDDVDIALFFFASHGLFDRLQCILGAAKYQDDIDPLRDRFEVGVAFALLDVNEIALVCERLGLNVWEIIHAAATKPFGFMPFYPGPGLGGHCIPIDPHYLSWKLRSLNFFTRFIDLAAEINRGMPLHVVNRIGLLLNQQKRALNGGKILVVGVTYKRDCADIRESPALDVIELLQQRGAEVVYFDPFVPELDIEGHAIRSAPLTRETLRAQDLVAIVTDHTGVVYRLVCEHAALVFDTRNATRSVDGPRERVHRL